MHSQTNGRNMHIASVLQDDIKDETHDNKKYLEQSDELEKLGRHQDAAKLRQIAEQEKQHSQIEQQILNHPDSPNNKEWIKNATNPKHKGQLRTYVKTYYGPVGFEKGDVENGKIKKEVLTQLSHSKNQHVRGEAQFALNANQ
jgi:rubrerythrin